METFKVTLDARGDSIDPKEWERELKEILERHYFVAEVEYIGEDESR